MKIKDYISLTPNHCRKTNGSPLSTASSIVDFNGVKNRQLDRSKLSEDKVHFVSMKVFEGLGTFFKKFPRNRLPRNRATGLQRLIFLLFLIVAHEDGLSVLLCLFAAEDADYGHDHEACRHCKNT